MTTALATSSDVQAALGRTLTAEETNRVPGMLLLASAAVEDATGYRFAPDDYTVGRKVRNGRVKLPAKVATVAEVRAIDQCDGSEETLTLTDDYTVRGSVVYCSERYVEVDFTVTEAVPNEIVPLVAGVVANTLSMPPAGVASEQSGPFNVSYISTSGRVFLAASDKAVLRRYKQAKPALDLLA